MAPSGPGEGSFDNPTSDGLIPTFASLGFGCRASVKIKPFGKTSKLSARGQIAWHFYDLDYRRSTARRQQDITAVATEDDLKALRELGLVGSDFVLIPLNGFLSF
ncbi:hypothetical protein WH297_23410 [Ochrobactrum vermis]|uniref:Uncharacterized protein n=1 Tax=Ochrobactrum vermis TaxID=1827297 RepID=A0ABU8PK87_9HYPH|nr:hypothetical protein [Ochrobactrum vermis]PQZ26877.1 hypothetical protein CQZ93_23735 [Ochrobactrum vermis]